MKLSQKILLGSTALVAASFMFTPKAMAVCATTGTIAADCDLNASTTGNIQIGDPASDVTVTITNSVTIGHTIDATATTQDTFIITDGAGQTVTQNAAIGGATPITRITIDATDTWNAAADVSTTEGFFFNAAGATLNVSAGTFSSSITGSSGADAVTFSGGTISGNVNLGDGNDGLTLSGGQVTGTLNGGSGANDSLSLVGVDYTTLNTISGFEAIDLNGQRLTVETAIIGVAGSTQSGLNVDGGNVDVNSGGSIDGTVYDDNAGVGTITFGADAAGGTFNLGGSIENVNFVISSGTVDTNAKTLGGVIGEELASITVNTGTRFNVNDNVTSSGVLTNTGTVFVDAGNTLTAATQGAGNGTFILELERDVVADTIKVGNIALTAGGLNLTAPTEIQISIPDSSGVLPERTELLIVNAAGAMTNGPGGTLTAVTDDSYIYDTYIVDGTGIETPTTAEDLYLVTTRKSLSGSSSTSANATVANVVFNALADNQDPMMASLQTSLIAATTQEQFNDNLQATLPTVDNGARAAGIASTEKTFTLTSNRLAGLRRGKAVSGMSSGGVTEGVKAWFQPFAQSVTQDPRQETTGYESKTYGAAVGFDNDSIFEDTILGFAVGMASSKIDSNNTNQTKTEVTSVILSVYGDHNFDNGVFLNAQVGYTNNDIKSTRFGVGGQSNVDARVDYGSQQFSSYVEVGKDYEWGSYTTLTPTVSAGLDYHAADVYAEQGAGGAGLIVDTLDSSVLDIGAGLEASWLYRKRSGALVKPKVFGKIEYDAIGDAVETKNTFSAGGPQFTITGSDPARLSYNIGAGFSYLARSNWGISSEYNMEYKEDYLAHTGFLKLSYQF